MAKRLQLVWQYVWQNNNNGVISNGVIVKNEAAINGAKMKKCSSNSERRREKKNNGGWRRSIMAWRHLKAEAKEPEIMANINGVSYLSANRRLMAASMKAYGKALKINEAGSNQWQ